MTDPSRKLLRWATETPGKAIKNTRTTIRVIIIIMVQTAGTVLAAKKGEKHKK
jgi:hypothetical protein